MSDRAGEEVPDRPRGRRLWSRLYLLPEDCQVDEASLDIGI